MKKTLMILLALSLLCIMAVGSTMSYLTYTDYDVNTMVVGNVKIEQIEQHRNNEGTLETFVDEKPLYPVTGLTENSFVINGAPYQLYNTNGNVVDKIVTVKNTGTQNAYIRTVFAFEMKLVDGKWDNPVMTDLMLNFNGNFSVLEDVTFSKTVMVDGKEVTTQYIVGVFYYGNNSILEPKQVSAPSLLQIYLNSSVGNEFYEAVGSSYDILVLSQAVQTAGFDNAEAALNAAFGEVTAVNAAGWFADAKEATA